MPKYIEVDQDGRVTGTCESPFPATAPEARGLILVPEATDLRDVTHRTYNAQTGAFGAKPAVRVIPLREFLRRWTQVEKITIETLSEAQTLQGRSLRLGWRELTAGTSVDLDNPDLAVGLTDIATVMMGAGVWADSTVAAQRIAAIRV